MTESTSRFAWRCLGSTAWPPKLAVSGERCWLCGGEIEEPPWRRRDAIPPTFTNPNLARAIDSDAVCQPCAYLGSGDSWREYCALLPERGWKSMHPLSWRSYSHVIAPGLHQTPFRSEWHEWLASPPDPPFIFVMALSGKKHLIFRARVSRSKNTYALQAEEDTLWVERDTMADVLKTTSSLLALGFSRKEINSGHYSPHRIFRARDDFRILTEKLNRYRVREPELIDVATFAARDPRKEMMA